MGVLNREALLARAVFNFEDVDVPELGGSVRIRDMGCLQRDRLNAFLVENKEESAFTQRYGEYKLLLLAFSICDEAGAALFEQADIQRLNDSLGFAVTDRLFEAAKRVNGMSKEAIDDRAKKSETPTGDSGTDSPATSDAPSGS